MRKFSISLATAALLASGCGSPASSAETVSPASSVNQEPSTAASSVASAEPSEAPTDVVWHVAPTIAATGVQSIYPTIPRTFAVSGYPQDWYPTGAPNDSIMLVVNGGGYLVNYDDEQIFQDPFIALCTSISASNPRLSALNYQISEFYDTGYTYEMWQDGELWDCTLSSDLTTGHINGIAALCGGCEGTDIHELAVIDNTAGTFTISADGESKSFAAGDLSAFDMADLNVAEILDGTYKLTGYAVIDQNGNIIFESQNTINGTELEFPYIVNERLFEASSLIDKSISTDRWGAIQSDKKLALVNGTNGEHLTKYIYDDAMFFEDGYCPVKKDGKWGYIDVSGQEVTDFIFDAASVLYNGLAFVGVNDTFGVIDLKTTLANGTPVTLSTCYDQYGGVPSEPETFPIYGTVLCTKDVHLRTGPGLSYSIIGYMPKEDNFIVYDEVEADGYTWLRIGDDQWVANDGTYDITTYWRGGFDG